MLEKPKSIVASPFKSAKWDELTSGRNFSKSDIPTLTLLCQWHEVIEQCMDDISDENGVHVAYQNDIGDVKAFPQLATMKQASAEIRALNKQLGINDEATQQPERKEAMLYVITGNRQDRRARTQNKGVAAG